MPFIELARFIRNLEESRELSPVKMFLACDELIPIRGSCVGRDYDLPLSCMRV